MERAVAHPLPTQDPVSGGSLVITELEGPDSGITLRGRFEVPRFARLNPDQTRFLETFLRCRGMLNSVEKEMGISYPTARARLDAILRVLDLANGRDELPEAPKPAVASSAPTPSGPVPPGEVGSAPEENGPVEFFGSVEEPPAPKEPAKRSPMELLDAIERGEISAEEAKREVGK